MREHLLTVFTDSYQWIDETESSFVIEKFNRAGHDVLSPMF
jgi:hypothetical protein